MCGIFAFTGPAGPDPGHLEAVALAAGRRGPHGHGWVTRGPGGELTSSTYRLGPVTASLPALRQATGPLLLGHTRLASFGDHDRRDQLQPVVREGHAVAHNGCIYNARDLALTDTDSQALATVYATARYGLGPEAALKGVLALAEHEAWAVAVADAGGGLYLTRRYHPLHLCEHPEGLYVCSWPVHQGTHLIPENIIIHAGSGASPVQDAACPPSRA